MEMIAKIQEHIKRNADTFRKKCKQFYWEFWYGLVWDVF